MTSKTVLCIGDPHIRVSNIADVDLFLERIVERVLATSQLDAIVVLGDTLHDHERLHTTPLNKAIEFFVTLSRYAPTWVLVGNHDMIGNQQFLTENHWLVAIKSLAGVRVVDHVEYCPELNAILLPYVPNGRFQEALDTGNTDPRDASVIFAHQEFRGCVMGAFISDHGDEYPETSTPVVSGHIHSNQQPQPNVYYPGSMLQHAFGESTRNVVALVRVPQQVETPDIVVDTGDTVDDGVTTAAVSVQEIDLELHRKITLYADAEEFEAISQKVPDDATHTRLVITGTSDEFKALRKKKVFKTLKTRGVKVVFKSRVLELAAGESHQTTDDFISVLSGMCDGTPALQALCTELVQETMQSM